MCTLGKNKTSRSIFCLGVRKGEHWSMGGLSYMVGRPQFLVKVYKKHAGCGTHSSYWPRKRWRRTTQVTIVATWLTPNRTGWPTQKTDIHAHTHTHMVAADKGAANWVRAAHSCQGSVQGGRASQRNRGPQKAGVHHFCSLSFLIGWIPN